MASRTVVCPDCDNSITYSPAERISGMFYLSVQDFLRLAGHVCYKNKGSAISGPLGKQIDGNHYKDFAIQPVEYISKNKLNWLEGNVVRMERKI